MRTSTPAVALLVLLLAPPAAAQPAAPAPERTVIYIQPLGRALPDVDVQAVQTALVRFYGLDVRLLPRAELPATAFTRARRRYRAEKLLTFIEPRMPADGTRILGLTSVDISTTKGKVADWGILGLATLDGSACVISSFRARKKARDAAHARERLAKVAVHEVGHTLGLEHCPSHGCLLEDARGKVATTDREYDICPTCRARLSQSGRGIPAKPEIPWPRPKSGAVVK